MHRFLPLLLLAAPVVAAEPAPPPRPLPDVSGLPAALKGALGDHFDFLGGEPGTTRGEVELTGRHRFWFAKLRARRAGFYKLEYTARLDTPVPNTFRPGDFADTAEFRFYVVVAKPGTKRIFQPQQYRGSTYPDALVGDTLLLPIHADAGRSRYRFAPVRWDPPYDPDYSLRAETGGWKEIFEAKWPPARIAVPSGLAVIAAPRIVIKPERDRVASDWVYAHLGFTAPGTFDLAPRRAHEPSGRPGRMSLDALLRAEAAVAVPPVSFRVMPRGQPITVLLANLHWMHPFQSGGGSGGCESLAWGTLEARVGDSVVLDCGISERPPAGAPAHDAVVEKLPFRDVPHYTPR